MSGPQQAAYFGMPHENLPDYLGLTAEQRTKWHALEEGFLAMDPARFTAWVRAHL